MISDFIANITKDKLFFYLVISTCILFFFTSLIKIELGHIFALIISIIVVVLLVINNNETVNDFNKELEYKLNSLLTNKDPPKYFYTDPDIINLFFNIKQDMSEYNSDAYINAIECANNVLKVKFDIERSLCNPPIVPDVHKNFTPVSGTVGYGKSIEKKLNDNREKQDFLNINQYNFIDDKKCNSILINAYENYQIAEEYLKKCMNYLHSFILIIPSEPVTNRKHEKILDRIHILLKRNLDIIKNKYEKSLKKGISHTTKFIDDYDLPKAYNKINSKNNAINNFNFF